MLQIIAGRSGCGKTELIYQKIYYDIENGKEVILIVPEQSSFQNEKRILNDLGAKKSSKVSVLSFSRLCDVVAEKYGGITKRRIDEGGKSVLMSLSIEKCADRLTLYGNQGKRIDLAELMMDVINEYKMCAISADDLVETSKNIQNERLKAKLEESALIYSAYNAILNRAYSDPNDDLTRLYETLLVHKYFEGKNVYIDSFNGYSGQERRVLECIFTQSDNVILTVGCEKFRNKDIKNSIFAEAERTFNQIKLIAEKNNVPLMPVIYLDEQKRYKAQSIAAIEESVYRYDGYDYGISDNAVSMYEAQDEYDEIEQTARDICSLVMDDSYSYSDITVICRQPENYKSIIETVFSKYNIPYFMSNPQRLALKPLFKLVLSAFDVIHSSFNSEKLFVFLKTGLTPLSDNEIFKLENFSYIWDIKGVRWKKPFTMNPDGNSETFDREELQKIEEIRKKAIEPLLSFSRALSKAQDGSEMAVCVYNLLDKMNCAEKIRNLVGYFDSCNEIKAKEEEAHIWDIMIDILDKIYTILKGSYMDSRRFAELFGLMIKKNDISDIPQTLDQVTIGTAGNIRTSDTKAVFVIGAVENVFPAIPVAGGIFSDSERCELIGAELPLYDSLNGMSLKEKYNVYAALSSPSERLFISRYKTDSKGGSCEPSSIFREVCAIVKNIHIRRREELSDNEIFRTEKQSISYCAEIWNDKNVRSDTLKNYFVSSNKYSDIISSIDRAVEQKPYKIYKKENIKRLYGDELHLSPSQIESYHLCAFAHFCKYGLRVFPRKKAVMDPSLYGTVVHFVLEKILSENGFKKFCSFDSEQLENLTQKYLEEYMSIIGGEGENTERFLAALHGMSKNIVIVLKRLIDEFKDSSFIPEDFELKVGGSDADIPGYEVELPTGEKIEIDGKIDRVDIFVKDEKKYIRVVDYKTGNKKFNLSDVLYGLNMQMMLYLYAVGKNGKERYSDNGKYELMPAGVLYMPSTPESNTGSVNNSTEQSKALKKQKEKFKMSGLLIDDIEILEAMEKNVQGIFIPAKMTKTNGLDSRSSNVIPDFKKIFSLIDKKIFAMAKSIYGGDIDSVPAKLKVDACQYCEYKLVCGFEDGKKTNVISSFSTDEAMKKIGEEVGNKDE